MVLYTGDITQIAFYLTWRVIYHV